VYPDEKARVFFVAICLRALNFHLPYRDERRVFSDQNAAGRPEKFPQIRLPAGAFSKTATRSHIDQYIIRNRFNQFIFGPDYSQTEY
jgi:hypothetical protein